MNIIYTPKTGGDWQVWGRNFLAVVTDTNAAQFGLTVDEWGAFGDAFTAFDAAYELAVDPSTRSTPKVADKDEKLAALRAVAGPIVGTIKNYGPITAEQLASLGIRPRATGSRRPKPRPAFGPEMSAFLTGPTSLRARAADPLDPTRRGKPADVAKLEVRWHFGPDIAGGPESWSNVALYGKTVIDLFFSLADDTTVWVSAAYVNGSGERGPFAAATSVRLPGTGAASQQATGDDELRIAA